jgi:hypothetical protein
MPPVTQLDRGPRSTCLAPHEVNAVLFYHLAQFVVWTQADTDVVSADPDLSLLLEAATSALSRSGTLEYPAGSDSSPMTNPLSNSENVASGVMSGGGQA